MLKHCMLKSVTVSSLLEGRGRRPRFNYWNFPYTEALTRGRGNLLLSDVISARVDVTRRREVAPKFRLYKNTSNSFLCTNCSEGSVIFIHLRPLRVPEHDMYIPFIHPQESFKYPCTKIGQHKLYLQRKLRSDPLAPMSRINGLETEETKKSILGQSWRLTTLHELSEADDGGCPSPNYGLAANEARWPSIDASRVTLQRAKYSNYSRVG